MRSALLAQRTEVPGAALDLVVLASTRRQVVGVDPISGAFVRARSITPLGDELRLRAYDICQMTVWPIPIDEHLDQPEAVAAAGIERAGRLPLLRRDRLMRSLLHPIGSHMLGFAGPSAPLWSFDGSRASVAVVEPERGPFVVVDERGVSCRFMFRALWHHLPLEDPALLSRLDWVSGGRISGRMLSDVLGFSPKRLVVVLARPRNGYCPKVVASFLPR